MSRKSAPIAANDNGKSPIIRVEVAESPMVGLVEVEIFDALISNIVGLVANDDDPPPSKEKCP